MVLPRSPWIRPSRLAARAAIGGAAIGLAVLAGAIAEARAEGEVNIYSARQEVLIRPLLDAFTQATGTKVNVVSGGEDALIERLKSEGANSPADVLLTVDAGRLIRAQENGSLQSVSSALLEASVPAAYRDPAGFWYGVSVRARPIMYATDRVKPAELSTYADLATAKWKGRICVRSSGHVYNQSMLAAMIAHDGVEKTEAWAKVFAANLARKPQGGDRDQIKAVASGECDVAIVNTYYLAGMIRSGTDEEKKMAAKVAVFWPDQAGHGTHVNVSGAGVTASAKNRANAIKLIEFLASDEAQRLYAYAVYEYPIRATISVGKPLADWGEFKADTLNLAALGKFNADAVMIADRAGWR
jgi:iron(III) transport system substrate-binding protein